MFAAKTENNIKKWGKSTSQKAVLGNKKELTKMAEDDIIKDIKACGINGDIHLTPIKTDINSLKFDEKHINKDRNHDVSLEEAKSFVVNAKFSNTVWKGKFERYFSVDGASYVNTEKLLIRTTYKKEQFGEDVKGAMEVIKKHGM